MTTNNRWRQARRWASAATLLALTGAAQAALMSLGDGTVKDTNTNLIWLQDWNVNGEANWNTQRNWANGLTFAGSSDWRLPEIGEFSALFAAYGDLRQRGEFTNVQSSLYFSGTESTAGFGAWSYRPGFGPQAGAQSSQNFAVAVRPGDLTATVPEPQTLALALLALGATALARRSRG